MLYWFDIKGRGLFALEPDSSALRRWRLPFRPSVGAPLGDGRLVIIGDNGVSRFDPHDRTLQHVHPFPDWPEGFRTNDGKVDPAGKLWWSVMDDDGGRRPGAVYRSVDGVARRMVEDVQIANSMAFSPDGRSYYLSDSARRTIWRFPFDPMSGELGERRVFAVFTNGEPDGAATDVEGGLWVAVWGGARVDRFAPDGELVASIPMPVSQPTSCAFGGADLSTLYVTSARDGLSDQALADEPLAGSLFALQVGVKGSPIPRFVPEP